MMMDLFAAPPNSSRKRAREDGSLSPVQQVPPSAGVALFEGGEIEAEDSAFLFVDEPPPVAVTTVSSTSDRLINPHTRNEALNELMELTANHENNFTLSGDDKILQALSHVFCDTIDWVYDESKDKVDKDPKFNANQAWIGHTSAKSQKWAKHCQKQLSPSTSLKLEQTRVLEVVITILRNMSFTSANLRLLAYSPCVLQILVGCLYESSSDILLGDDNFLSMKEQKTTVGTRPGYLALPSLHILVNLAPYLDVTGQKLLCDKMFLATSNIDDSLVKHPKLVPSPETFGQLAQNQWGFGGLWLAKRLDTKEDVVQDVTQDMLLKLTASHIHSVWDIFPALAFALTNTHSPRLVVMGAVDLLQEFINHAKLIVTGVDGRNEEQEDDDEEDDEIPDARSIVINIPDVVLQRIMDLLYVPRLGPDSMEYPDPVHNIVTRVNTLKLLMGYDATVDTDVRDRALDVLVPLLELDSPNMAKRVGVVGNKNVDGGTKINNRLLDAIVPILATQVGRNEAPQLASSLLKEFSKAKENRTSCMFLQQRILRMASTDQRVAHLAFNSLIPTIDDENSSTADKPDTN